MNPTFSFKKATLDDAHLLYNWANDPTVRKNAINTQNIAWENHRSWLEEKLKNPNSLILILFQNEDPIGQIRLDWHNEFWLIDYSIDSIYRGLGLGKKIIELIIKETYKPLKAVVRKTNESSNKIFINCGFQSNEIKINNEDYFEYIYK